MMFTAVLSEAWAKLRDWASVAGRGWLLLSGSVAHASLETTVCNSHKISFLYRGTNNSSSLHEMRQGLENGDARTRNWRRTEWGRVSDWRGKKKGFFGATVGVFGI